MATLWIVDLPPGALQIVAVLDAGSALVELQVHDSPVRSALRGPGVEAPAVQELRRAVLRSVRGKEQQDPADVQQCLRRVAGLWVRTRRRTPLLLSQNDGLSIEGERPAPRAFLEHVGSNFVEISWEPLGGIGQEADAYEVEAFKFIRRAEHNSSDSPGLQSIGRFPVQGRDARRYTLRRLEPLSYHKIRIRVLGPGRRWTSAWSEFLSVKTIGVDEARARGRPMSADGFFVRSEKRICRAIRGSSRGGSSRTDGGLLPTAEEVQRLREEVIGDALDAAFGPAEKVEKTTLDARSYKDWSHFVRMGSKYSRLPSERGERLQRMRMVLAAQDLYDPSYAEECPWSMGPLYYEEVGDRAHQDWKLQRLLEQAAQNM
eukprot:gnl/MRDRNA2_/MRDRNA2_34241_c0_seq1.p1 gnl/MRDRNA2_/MRDRNA2_34241_c0~~gnl/MRDRNA2_/MRDRNA2_34241_c0_seq1.p1  ORF type:complete len:390 (-),score=67.74 gnl/MRDRNA2_/MRDRNA2_34241_c0_seq1:154-1275(-)